MSMLNKMVLTDRKDYILILLSMNVRGKRKRP